MQKLQTLPGGQQEFLFEVLGDEIVLKPGVAEELTRFASVLCPLIEFQFAELVGKINKDQLDQTVEHDLHEHLFDRDRFMPPEPLRHSLKKIQNHRCIFTGVGLHYESLDHVIPWSRARLSHLENFVVTTKSVNSSKSNSLMNRDLIEKWLDFSSSNSKAIGDLANEHGWPTDPERVFRTDLSIYRSISPGVGVWDGNTLAPLGQDAKNDIVKLLSAQCSTN